MINKKSVLITLAALAAALAVGWLDTDETAPVYSNGVQAPIAESSEYDAIRPSAGAFAAVSARCDAASVLAPLQGECDGASAAQQSRGEDELAAPQSGYADSLKPSQIDHGSPFYTSSSENTENTSAPYCGQSPQVKPGTAIPAFGQAHYAELAHESADTADTESVPSAAPGSIFMIEPAAAPANAAQPRENVRDGFEITVLSVGSKPQKSVLIYHTHTYEAYEQDPQNLYYETERWRTADSRFNTVRVGEELAALLRALGINVTHDTTAFEPPVLSGAYSRSMDMLAARRAAGENYDMYIDLHRDAYTESQSGLNTVSVSGTDVARLMLLIGKGEGQTSAGFDEKPDWQANLAAAQAVTDSLNAQVAGLCKKVCVKSGRYNQHMGSCCVLIEAGNNKNTLDEALAAMPYLADAIAETLAVK